MAKMLLSGLALQILQTRAEKFWGMHQDLTVPLENVVGAKALDKTSLRTLGLRLPGTGIPGLIIAGRFVKGKKVAWVSWTRGNEILQIDLVGHALDRIVVGVPHAKDAAAELNAWLKAKKR